MDDDAAPDPDRNIPAVRASDAERHETAQILQQAFSEGRLTVSEFDERTSQAYQARFRPELEQLTADLSPARREPESSPGRSIERPGDRAPADRVTGSPGTSASIAVMSGCERSGVWTIGSEHTAVAVMGGVAVDLRQARFQSPETTIRAFAVWGGIQILVPDDVHVVTDGIGLMGGFAEESGTGKKDPRPVRQAPPGAPTIRVTGLALMGGVEVRRVSRPEYE